MDCPSEEALIRMKLAHHASIAKLEFQLAERTLTVYHDEPDDSLFASLVALDLDAHWVRTEEASGPQAEEFTLQSKLLWQVLAINLVFFMAETAFGFISDSMGLVSDGLDMLSDAIVYGLSLLAVGAAVVKKQRVARASGYLQMALALLGMAEVLRRFFLVEALPDPATMAGVSALALVANGWCLVLLQRAKSQDAHMQASLIFTSNDVLVNAGVIAAAGLVTVTGSRLPDLLIGLFVFALVLRGAFRILKLAK